MICSATIQYCCGRYLAGQIEVVARQYCTLAVQWNTAGVLAVDHVAAPSVRIVVASLFKRGSEVDAKCQVIQPKEKNRLSKRCYPQIQSM